MSARLKSPGARVALVRHMGRRRRVDALLAGAAADRAELSASIARLTEIRSQIAAALESVR